MSDTQISKDLQTRIFELTLALYRVTDFFPVSETLRNHLREKADEIWGALTEYGYGSNSAEHMRVIIGKIKTIRGYLGIARSMNFVKPINLIVLEQQYGFFEHFLNEKLATLSFGPDFYEYESREYKNQEQRKKISKGHSDTTQMSDRLSDSIGLKSDSLNERQKAIVNYLKKTAQATISDFLKVFNNNVSSKTVQRELQDLAAKMIVQKQGQKRWTIYRLL